MGFSRNLMRILRYLKIFEDFRLIFWDFWWILRILEDSRWIFWDFLISRWIFVNLVKNFWYVGRFPMDFSIIFEVLLIDWEMYWNIPRIIEGFFWALEGLNSNHRHQLINQAPFNWWNQHLKSLKSTATSPATCSRQLCNDDQFQIRYNEIIAYSIIFYHAASRATYRPLNRANYDVITKNSSAIASGTRGALTTAQLHIPPLDGSTGPCGLMAAISIFEGFLEGFLGGFDGFLGFSALHHRWVRTPAARWQHRPVRVSGRH